MNNSHIKNRKKSLPPFRLEATDSPRLPSKSLLGLHPSESECSRSSPFHYFQPILSVTLYQINDWRLFLGYNPIQHAFTFNATDSLFDPIEEIDATTPQMDTSCTEIESQLRRQSSPSRCRSSNNWEVAEKNWSRMSTYVIHAVYWMDLNQWNPLTSFGLRTSTKTVSFCFAISFQPSSYLAEGVNVDIFPNNFDRKEMLRTEPPGEKRKLSGRKRILRGDELRHERDEMYLPEKGDEETALVLQKREMDRKGESVELWTDEGKTAEYIWWLSQEYFLWWK